MEIFFNHKLGSFAHSLSLSRAHRPSMTEILLKRMYNRKSSIHLYFSDMETTVYMTYIYNPGYFCVQREDSLIDEMSEELQKFCQVQYSTDRLLYL